MSLISGLSFYTSGQANLELQSNSDRLYSANVNSTNFQLQNPHLLAGDVRTDDEVPQTKPSVKQLMEKLTGMTMSEIDSSEQVDAQELFRTASDLLHGVVGSNTDTRNWQKVMESSTPRQVLASETTAMYQPIVKMKTQKNLEGETISEYPVIYSSEGLQLRALSGSANDVKSNFENFGIISSEQLGFTEPEVLSANIDEDLRNFLLRFLSSSS